MQPEPKPIPIGMSRNLIVGIMIGAAVVGVTWLIVDSRGRFPGGESDFAGSRSFGVPWEAPAFFSPEKNVLPPKVEKVLNSGQQFTLLSLDPAYLSDADKQRLGPDALFHEFRILGKAELRDPSERATLVRALLAGIADANGTPVNCFDPRHGISATLDGETLELLICFECLQIKVFFNGQPLIIDRFAEVLTSRLPRPLFNLALKKAGLPLARSRD